MPYRAILIDIDGTLVNGKKQITPRTREALLTVQEAGVRLVLASGRPDQGVAQFGEVLGMPRHGGLYCCSNGARVLRADTGEILFDQVIPQAEVAAVLRHLTKFDVTPMVASGAYMYVPDVFRNTITYQGKPFAIMQYESRSNGYLLCEARDMAETCTFPVNKILTFGEPAYLEAHAEEMAAPFSGRVNAMFTAPYYFEYTAPGIDKAKSLSTVLTALSYAPEELMAFGDAQNDLSMLRLAGLGIAMGNAVPAMKEAADEVTASNEEDGIAEALIRHFPALF